MNLRDYIRGRRLALLNRLDRFQGLPSRRATRRIVKRFHRLFFHQKFRTWANTRFLGVPVAKNPLDLWVYQEIIFEVRPDVIIETGTAHGGSAFYMATLCELLGKGRVVSVDIAPLPPLPRHERVTFMTASSVDPATVESIRGTIMPSEVVMVVLDSNHERSHVLEEMRRYGELVTPGSYMIVEDTNINGHPVFWAHGPGPMEAVEEFLSSHTEFVIDETREKYFFTFNPRGYLRKLPSAD